MLNVDKLDACAPSLLTYLSKEYLRSTFIHFAERQIFSMVLRRLVKIERLTGGSGNFPSWRIPLEMRPHAREKSLLGIPELYEAVLHALPFTQMLRKPFMN